MRSRINRRARAASRRMPNGTPTSTPMLVALDLDTEVALVGEVSIVEVV